MLCPKCQKEGAKVSSAYPDILVHKCDGTNLIEVGKSLSKEDKSAPSTDLVETTSISSIQMNELERKAINNALIKHKGNLTEAAKDLGIGRATLYRKVKEYGIDVALARKKSKEGQ